MPNRIRAYFLRCPWTMWKAYLRITYDTHHFYIAAAMAAGLLFNRLAKLVSPSKRHGIPDRGPAHRPVGIRAHNDRRAASLSPFVDIALGFIAYSIGGEFKLSTIKKIGTKSITITLFSGADGRCARGCGRVGLRLELPLALTLARSRLRRHPRRHSWSCVSTGPGPRDGNAVARRRQRMTPWASSCSRCPFPLQG